MQTLKDYLEINCRISEAISRRFFTSEELEADLNEEDLNKRQINTERIITAGKPVFVTERAIDALSIIEAGGEAVAIGADPGKLLIFLYNATRKEGKELKHMLIIAFNPGEEKQTDAETLANLLKQIDAPLQIADICNGHEDINTAYFCDIEGFKKTIKQEIAKEYLCTSASYSLKDFANRIKASASNPPISTGFYNLDKVLDGGLYAGLYFIGAVSSLGKTTFTLQTADNLAKQGQDVLIFSLEMAKEELIAKSISRITYQEAKERRNAKTTRGILSGARYEGYSQTEKDLIEDAIALYADYAQHIYIHEGIGNIGVEDIKTAVKAHIESTGNKPVIIIDYVQILAAYDIRLSDKQATDRNVTELKRLSRDYEVPVIAISSFNRDNYTEPVNLTSFKESGSIEYSSDTLIGLQYEGMDYSEEDKDDKTRRKRIRKLLNEVARLGRDGEGIPVQLKVLKNRNGSRGQVLFDFYAMFNYFCENDGFIPAPEGTEDLFKNARNLKAK